MKKQCPACTREWGIAKKVCSCGNALWSKQSRRPVVTSRRPSRKLCPECGITWATNQMWCTCGHSFRSRPKKRKYNPRGNQSCSKCGLVRKGHICQATRSREPRPSRVAAPIDVGVQPPDHASAPKANLEAGEQTPARPSKSAVRCGVCSLQIHISRLTEQCTATTGNTDFAKIKQALQVVEETAKLQIAKLREQITHVKQLVDKTCPTKCAFALMR